MSTTELFLSAVGFCLIGTASASAQETNTRTYETGRGVTTTITRTNDNGAINVNKTTSGVD